MRSNSDNGKGNNNLHDPTLRDKEREQGVSGEAIEGERKVGSERKRTDSR